MNNSSLISNLLLRPTEWDKRDKTQREVDKEMFHSLGQNQALSVLLRYLEWQKGQALSPVDLTNPNWREIALVNKGRVELIIEIANQFN